MAGFMVFYASWFGPAWQKPGWSIFATVCLYAAWLLNNGIHNIRYAATLPRPATDDQSSTIEKQMQRLSMWTYIPLWIIAITLCVCRQFEYVLPVITVIIGLHFLPQARIFSRTIDYLLTPAPICSSLLAIYIAATTQTSWLTIFAISGVGGAIATGGYGLYMVITAKQLKNSLASSNQT